MLMPFPVSYFPRPHCHGISRWFFKPSRRPLPFLRRIEIMGSSSTTVSWKFWQKPRTKGRISGVLWEERFIAAVRRMMTFQRRAVYRSASWLVTWRPATTATGALTVTSDDSRPLSPVFLFTQRNYLVWISICLQITSVIEHARVCRNLFPSRSFPPTWPFFSIVWILWPIVSWVIAGHGF